MSNEKSDKSYKTNFIENVKNFKREIDNLKEKFINDISDIEKKLDKLETDHLSQNSFLKNVKKKYICL